jgi:ABC-type dipeptide/oligopeptide/nickel transport system permease subunit/ABC-type dipeptide/oligopeptide/nickel transport system ATPase component
MRTWRFRLFCGAVLTAGAALSVLALSCVDAAALYTPYMEPGLHHLLGTDSSGRDVLALLILSSGTSLTIGIGAALCATAIGALIGCAAGYWRSTADDLLMRLTDIFLLLPTLPLVIVLTAYLGPGILHVALVIALTLWPSTARVVRSQVLKLREEPFVTNARSMGAGSFYLIRRHILPNCTEMLLAKSALNAAASMLAEAGVGFLGLGDPVHPSWGSMLHDAFTGSALINGYWWWSLPPILCIAASVTLSNFAGQALAGRKPVSAPQAVPVGVDIPAEGIPSLPQLGEDEGIPPLLAIHNLTITFPGSPNEERPVVDGLDLKVQAGEKIVVIGATGSGKSLLLLAIIRLLPIEAQISGEIWVGERNIETLSPDELRRYRGVTAAYVPQGVGSALNPVLPVGRQATERARIHHSLGQREAVRRAVVQLEALGLAQPERLIRDYPHHLSGGMKQRVVLASALAGTPSLLLADEPTKGLDPEAVEDVIEMFKGLKREAVLAVTHDLVFAEALGGSVMVMHAGVVVEQAPSASFFRGALHPYCRALIAAQPAHGMVVDAAVVNRIDAQRSKGCTYRGMCPLAEQQCLQRPPLFLCRKHRVRCWRYAS